MWNTWDFPGGLVISIKEALDDPALDAPAELVSDPSLITKGDRHVSFSFGFSEYRAKHDTKLCSIECAINDVEKVHEMFENSRLEYAITLKEMNKSLDRIEKQFKMVYKHL